MEQRAWKEGWTVDLKRIMIYSVTDWPWDLSSGLLNLFGLKFLSLQTKKDVWIWFLRNFFVLHLLRLWIKKCMSVPSRRCILVFKNVNTVLKIAASYASKSCGVFISGPWIRSHKCHYEELLSKFHILFPEVRMYAGEIRFRSIQLNKWYI